MPSYLASHPDPSWLYMALVVLCEVRVNVKTLFGYIHAHCRYSKTFRKCMKTKQCCNKRVICHIKQVGDYQRLPRRDYPFRYAYIIQPSGDGRCYDKNIVALASKKTGQNETTWTTLYTHLSTVFPERKEITFIYTTRLIQTMLQIILNNLLFVHILHWTLSTSNV